MFYVTQIVIENGEQVSSEDIAEFATWREANLAAAEFALRDDANLVNDDVTQVSYAVSND